MGLTEHPVPFAMTEDTGCFAIYKTSGYHAVRGILIRMIEWLTAFSKRIYRWITAPARKRIEYTRVAHAAIIEQHLVEGEDSARVVVDFGDGSIAHMSADATSDDIAEAKASIEKMREVMRTKGLSK